MNIEKIDTKYLCNFPVKRPFWVPSYKLTPIFSGKVNCYKRQNSNLNSKTLCLFQEGTPTIEKCSLGCNLT